MPSVVSPLARLCLLLSTLTHKTSLFSPGISGCFTKMQMSIDWSLGFAAAGLWRWLWAILMFSTDYHACFSPTQHLKWFLMFLLSSLLKQEKRALPNTKRQMRNTLPRQSMNSLEPTYFTIFLPVNIFPRSPKWLCVCTDEENTQRYPNAKSFGGICLLILPPRYKTASHSRRQKRNFLYIQDVKELKTLYFCNTSGTSCYWRQNTELDR